MASPSSFLCFLSLLSLLSSSTSTITIPLSHFHTNPSPSLDPYQTLTHLASTSLTRAHHLKNPPIVALSTTPHSYGGYSISLSFGTPPQTIPFVMDTGSDFNWFPCTHRYLCKNCSFSDPPIIPSFIPKLSSSSKILGCENPRCGWIHNPDARSRCQDCQPSSKNCTEICPPYLILYGSGTTGGITLLETLDLPGKKVPDFVVGCSLFSSRQPAGISGFGRGSASLPSQLGLKKFSYCLLAHQFDDSSESSLLMLDAESDSGHKTDNVSYTPFVTNPVVAERRAFSVYYYVGLRKITVGVERVKIPYKYLSPGSDGTGGTIVDSGTTFTYMNNMVFKLVIGSFLKQVKNYKRASYAESLTGLGLCFNVSGTKTVSLPEIVFHFKGGAKMALPLSNYFAFVGNGVVCFTMVSDGVLGPESSGGPSIILGNFQMQNYYVEYDLRNDRLGFRQQSCK
ncbi:probable aspartyl protease At4g16563 [Cornus florida]|uniref:probable aspartyl protease At4g16563 n=1 Tax=Cornus florida TaxID=4283 RepID=UPI0028A0BF05|nr:probable aspartyl protease At4g16563 [Cornus florida]